MNKIKKPKGFLEESKDQFRTIIVHFRNKKDMLEFGKLINQRITFKTKFLNYKRLDK